MGVHAHVACDIHSSASEPSRLRKENTGLRTFSTLGFSSGCVLSFDREDAGVLQIGLWGRVESHVACPLSRVLWLRVRPGLHMGGRRGPTHKLQANQLFSQTGQAEKNNGEIKRKVAEVCGGNERSRGASMSSAGKERTALLFQ